MTNEHDRGHALQDRVSLALARRVAERLQSAPSLIQTARDNLARWSRLNAGAPQLLACYAEWAAILERPVAEVCELLCAETELGQRLRQNSPFAGILSPREVWAIKSAVRAINAKTAA